MSAGSGADASTPVSPPKRAAGGVYNFACLFICLNILGAFCALIAPTGDTDSALRDVKVAMLFVFLGLVSAAGLLRLREWARWVTLALALIVMAWSGSSAVRTPNPVNILTIAWTGYIVWYFLRPSVKAQFVSKTTNR